MKKILLLILLSFCIHKQASCCECPRYSMAESYVRSDFVAIGHIIQVNERDSLSYEIEIEIIELFKGDTINKLIVYSSPRNSNFNSPCELYVNQGETWLLMANSNESNYGIGYCSLSCLLSKLPSNELEILRNPEEIILERVFSTGELDSFPVLSDSDYTLIERGFSSHKDENGIVFVKLTIDRNGEIVEKEVSRGISVNLDNKALEIVDLFGKIKPARFRGYDVSSEYIIPIKFKNN